MDCFHIKVGGNDVAQIAVNSCLPVRSSQPFTFDSDPLIPDGEYPSHPALSKISICKSVIDPWSVRGSFNGRSVTSSFGPANTGLPASHLNGAIFIAMREPLTLQIAI